MKEEASFSKVLKLFPDGSQLKSPNQKVSVPATKRQAFLTPKMKISPKIIHSKNT